MRLLNGDHDPQRRGGKGVLVAHLRSTSRLGVGPRPPRDGTLVEVREGQMMTLREVVDLFPSRRTQIPRQGSKRTSRNHPARYR